MAAGRVLITGAVVAAAADVPVRATAGLVIPVEEIPVADRDVVVVAEAGAAGAAVIKSDECFWKGFPLGLFLILHNKKRIVFQ